jgi:hypothetical protein
VLRVGHVTHASVAPLRGIFQPVAPAALAGGASGDTTRN